MSRSSRAVARCAVRPAPFRWLATLLVLAGLDFAGLAPWAARPAAAQSVPTTLNYQGRLLQNTAEQDSVGGSIDIVFSIWTGPASDAGAAQLWSESWTGVSLSNGIFSVLLGSNGSPLNPADFQSDSSLYLQLVIEGETLLPRQQLGSAPFAMVDEPANELQDLELAGDQLGLSGSAVKVDLAPYLVDHDEQDLSLAGNVLSLSGDATPVDLSLYLVDHDEQDLSLAGNVLSLSGDATPVDLSSFLDNTDAQTLSLAGNTLLISGSGSSVDLGQIPAILATSARPSWVFSTGQTYSGAQLGGLAGADAKCQALADAAGLGGTYMAWLSDSTGSPSTRFNRSAGPWILVTGDLVAGDWDDLTDGTIEHAIDRNEYGAVVGVGSARWTGTTSAGELAGSHCSNWSATSGTAVVGFTSTFSNWTEHPSPFPCAAQIRLYCFDQSGSGAFGGVGYQHMVLTGNDLTLTTSEGPNVVNLAPFSQTLSLSGNTLAISGSGSSVDLSGATSIVELSERVGVLEGASMAFSTSTLSSGALGGPSTGANSPTFAVDVQCVDEVCAGSTLGSICDVGKPGADPIAVNSGWRGFNAAGASSACGDGSSNLCKLRSFSRQSALVDYCRPIAGQWDCTVFCLEH